MAQAQAAFLYNPEGISSEEMDALLGPVKSWNSVSQAFQDVMLAEFYAAESATRKDQ